MLFKEKYQLLFLCAILMMSFSCGKESSCFKGTGKIITEQRAITSDVITIKTEDKIDIVITQGTEASLVVEGGENMLPYINTEVSGSELQLSSDNKCSMFRDYSIPVTVYLTLPNLTRIDYTGQGLISSANTLNFPDFTFDTKIGTGSINLSIISNSISIIQHTGPADITLTGYTNELYCYTGGNGWMYLNNLNASNVHTNNAGSGDIIVNASNTLLVELTSIGNIDYYGNPVLSISQYTGPGLLRKK